LAEPNRADEDPRIAELSLSRRAVWNRPVPPDHGTPRESRRAGRTGFPVTILPV